MTNRLYYGDNLGVLREHIASESVDLVYLDPPFNSNATYNVLFKAPDGHQSQAQIEAFDDTWHWTESAEDAYWQVLRGPNTDAASLLKAMKDFLGLNDMMAYLAMMAIRLIELHRVLKPTGSLYLHCDPTASHYLKLLLDAVFGKMRFQNEIIWSYRRWPTKARQFQRMHDVILFYSKDKEPGVFNTLYQEASESSIKRWKGKKQRVTFANSGQRNPTEETDENSQVPLNSVWPIPVIAPVSKERLGYPTQKPVALLERIIAASSNPGDVVLDPFCGCGTTVHAAQKLGRQWIGIDVTHLAISLIERRLREAFGTDAQFQTVGVPKDIGAARDLAARDKHEFEKWAITLIPDAQPFRGGRKGADTGIDGIVYLKTGKNETAKAIVEVKGGGVSVDQVHKLKSVIEREKALAGLFVTLEKPTRQMVSEAAAAGFAETDYGRIPRIQILTIEGILNYREVPRLPVIDATAFKKAPKEKQGGQGSLDL